MIGTGTTNVCVSESIPSIVRIIGKYFLSNETSTLAKLRTKRDSESQGGKGTPHANFVNFSFRGSLVRRNTNDVVSMEKS